MKSPTSSILHSIQALKTKLRSDHLQLQGLRRDFAMGPTKPIIEIQQRQQSPLYNQFKSNKSLQKNTKNKIIQLRKSHQNQLKAIHENYKHQKQQLIQTYQLKIEQITKIFQQKISQQELYVHLLQDQLESQKNQLLCTDQFVQTKSKSLSFISKTYDINLNFNHLTFDNKIEFQLFKKSFNDSQPRLEKYNEFTKDQKQNKYEQIVNNLLNQNATLLESVQTLKMQNRKLIHNSMMLYQKQTSKINVSSNFQKQSEEQYHVNAVSQVRQNKYFSVVPLVVQDSIRQSSYRNSCQGNKNRLKFSKSNGGCKNNSQRSFMSNNQNIDTSNIFYRHTNSIQKINEPLQQIESSIIEDEQSEILSQQIKLKTIKHFIKAVSHRSTQCQQISQNYQMKKIVNKKGNGIRNALKILYIN